VRRIFNNVKNRIKYSFYSYWHRKLVKSKNKEYMQAKALNASQSSACEGISRLSCAKRGTCKFVSTCCDEQLSRRLSEMGFIPGGDIKVVERASGSSRGGVMVEVKGSKLALSEQIADNIFIKESK